MLTLNPPFQADDFDGLYKKVMSGKYNKINSRYSEDMNELLKLLFKVDPKERPNCDEILKSDLVRKRIEFFKAETGLDFDDIDAMDENVLLKTIKLSSNLFSLKDNLPKPNYSLPKINNSIIINQTKLNNANNFQNEALLTINNNTSRTNQINTVRSKLRIFSPKINNKINKDNSNLNKVRLNSDPKEIHVRNRIKELYNLYSYQKNKILIPKIKKPEEKKNININIKKSNNISNNDKRIFETYKLYLSKDMRKYLLKSKKYKLPKINKYKSSIIK